MDRHSELEWKFIADNVSQEEFALWCQGLHPVRFDAGSFPDRYYRQGESVVRHRMSCGAGEVTTKLRKSECDITDRMEINLKFETSTSPADVTAFLGATGWKLEFTLLKVFSHVFWFKHGSATIAVSLYEVERSDTHDRRRFLEVEIEHDSKIAEPEARNLLGLWGGSAASEFALDEPMTDSLYEIYSGRRYASVAPCTRPPSGWRCTRGAHADGPCAAIPDA